MKTYARIQDGVVAELFSTAADIGQLFSPALQWIDVTAIAGVAENWCFDGTTFSPPPASPAPALPTLALLQAQLQVISARIAALSSATATPAQ